MNDLTVGVVVFMRALPVTQSSDTLFMDIIGFLGIYILKLYERRNEVSLGTENPCGDTQNDIWHASSSVIVCLSGIW